MWNHDAHISGTYARLHNMPSLAGRLPRRRLEPPKLDDPPVLAASRAKGRSVVHPIDKLDPIHFNDGQLPDGTLKALIKDREFFTMGELKICKASQGGPWGPRAMHNRCKIDETCHKCTKPWHRAQAKRLIDAYPDPALRGERRSFIREHFPDKNEPVVLIATDRNHFPYVLNWACGCRAHFSGDMEKHTLVVAADEDTYEFATRAGFHSIHPSKYNVSPRHLNKAWAKKMNLTRNNVAKMGFPDSMAMLVTCMAELLDMGYTVISQDADVVWKYDARDYLESPGLRNIHLATQMAPRPDAQGPVNTGFVFIRPSEITRVFLRSLIQLLPLFYMRVDDQVVWNSLLRHYWFRQLHVSILPRKHVLDLHDYTAKWIDGDTQVLHTVSNSKKIRRLRSHGEWHFTDSCPYYDKALERFFPEWDL